MTMSGTIAMLRAAWWAKRSLRVARAQLGEGEVRAIVLPEPPVLPAAAMRAVDVLLCRRNSTCLERALVRQRWLAAHGRAVPIAIGVTAPSRGFAAHAWLVGEDDPVPAGYHELMRLEP